MESIFVVSYFLLTTKTLLHLYIIIKQENNEWHIVR